MAVPASGLERPPKVSVVGKLRLGDLSTLELRRGPPPRDRGEPRDPRSRWVSALCGEGAKERGGLWGGNISLASGALGPPEPGFWDPLMP